MIKLTLSFYRCNSAGCHICFCRIWIGAFPCICRYSTYSQCMPWHHVHERLITFAGSYSRYQMRLHRSKPNASAGSALSHCQESIDRAEITPLLSDSGEATGTNVVATLSDNDSTTVLKQEKNPIQGEVHQSTYFSTAKERAHVPFLDHQILEIDFSSQRYTLDGHDITLRIPEGAVAEGEKIHFASKAK